MSTNNDEKSSKGAQVSSLEVRELQGQDSWHGGPVVPELKEWKAEVQLQKSGIGHWVANLLYLAFPAAFIALGIVIAAHHNKTAGNGELQGAELWKKQFFYAALGQAIKVSVTLYPIAFGLVLCKLLKTVTNYKAERGASLITLEQLNATKSFGSALTVPYNFRRLDKTSIILVALWITSPLTSQALQRMFRLGYNTISVTQESVFFIDYLSTQPTLFLGVLSNLYASNNAANPRDISTFARPAQLLQELLMASTYEPANAVVDVFGNPRVPSLESVMQQIEPSTDGWYDVTTESLWPFEWGKDSHVADLFDRPRNITVWSSLAGLPLGNVPANSTSHSTMTNFTAATGYWQFQCEAPIQITSDQLTVRHANLSDLDGWLPNCAIDPTLTGFNLVKAAAACSFTLHGQIPDCVDYNLTGPAAEANVLNCTTDSNSFSTAAFRLDPQVPNTEIGAQQRLQFISQTAFSLGGGSTWYYGSSMCNLSRHSIEIDVTCAGDACATRRVRPGPQLANMGLEPACVNEQFAGDDTNNTICTQYIDRRDVLTGILSSFMKANPPSSSSDLVSFTNSGFEAWLTNASRLDQSPAYGGDGESSFTHLDLTPAQNISQRLTMAFNSYYNLAMGYTTFGNGISKGEIQAPFFNITSAPSTVTKTQAVYKANWGWLAVVWLSSLLVIALIVLNAVLQHKTLAPDLLGYVSTLTYNNPNIPLPSGGNALDAIDRSRQLADLKVRFLDVRPDGETGHIALSTVPGRPLEGGRKYS